MKAAQRKIEEKYGDLTEKHQHDYEISDDQVEREYIGTNTNRYNLFKSQLMSPYLPIMTAVGNHETYNDPGMQRYAAHYHYENLTYQVSAVARKTITPTKPAVSFSLFCPLNIPADAQKEWVRKIVDAAKKTIL